MAIDKRATRLGVLGLVGLILFSLIGVRLWFLQTVKADELQALSTISRTRTVRIPPERGRIFDLDGRILADNQRILTVAVDWQQLRKRTTPVDNSMNSGLFNLAATTGKCGQSARARTPRAAL